jgi:hypothetical protein
MTRESQRFAHASTLVCWNLDESLLQQLSCLDHEVRRPNSIGILAEELCSRDSSILLYLLPDKENRQSDLWGAVNNARARGSSLALIAIAVGGYSSYASVLDGARAGIASILEASPRLDVPQLRASIEDAERSLGAARVWNCFSNSLPQPLSDPASTLLRRIIALAHEPVSLSALAYACQLHERSLRKYCTKHRLPEPNRLIALCRLLRAAHSIDDGMTIETLCAHLAFPSGEALRKLASRTLRVPLSRLVQGGAAELVREYLKAELFRVETHPNLALLR